MDNLYVCRFCGKTRNEVNHIIVGLTPADAICNECVSLSHKINMRIAAGKQEQRILEDMRRFCFYEIWGTD